jgi:hypothetical protein
MRNTYDHFELLLHHKSGSSFRVWSEGDALALMTWLACAHLSRLGRGPGASVPRRYS